MPDDTVPSVQEHRDVLGEAVAIFLDRNARYQDLWRLMPADEMLTQMQHKLRRVDSLHNRDADCRDDVLDLINYCTFFVMNGFAGEA